MNGDDFFMQMCDEAMSQIAKGDQGWKKADYNTLLLASFGMLCKHLSKKITKPLWFFASAVATGVVGYLINIFAG